MRLPLPVLTVFPPSDDRLMDLLCQQIDAGMLNEIAAADYAFDVPQHVAALREIIASRRVSGPLDWHPSEVLELIRNSEPDNPHHKPGGQDQRGHRMRAFASTVLLVAGVQQGELHEFALAQLLRSSAVLETEVSHALGCLLTDGIPKCQKELEWLAPVALLIVATRSKAFRPLELIPPLVDWMLNDPECISALMNFEAFEPFGKSSGAYAPLRDELERFATGCPDGDVRSRVRLIAATLG